MLMTIPTNVSTFGETPSFTQAEMIALRGRKHTAPMMPVRVRRGAAARWGAAGSGPADSL